jgi:4-alpha-glucanotransferase
MQIQGVMIIGDVTIFVAHDSAEVWAKPELFYLNNPGRQLWLPVYRQIIFPKLGNCGGIHYIVGMNMQETVLPGG